MPPYTKKAIIDSFIKILSKKSLDKVTVRDIVDDCGVNRNTFYYYFQDVYAVVEDIFNYEGQKITEMLSGNTPMSEVFGKLMEFFTENKRTVKNIYESIIKENFETYISDAVAEITSFYINEAVLSCEIPPERIDKERLGLITIFCCQAFTGYIIQWFKEGMKNDIQKTLNESCRLFEFNLPSVLVNCFCNYQ